VGLSRSAALNCPQRPGTLPSAQSVEGEVAAAERAWGAFNNDKILIFDDLRGVLDELLSYARELDEVGEVTDKIDAKETFHFMDAIRYLVGYLNPNKPKATMNSSPVARQGLRNW
jgi:hypothetical protein